MFTRDQGAVARRARLLAHKSEAGPWLSSNIPRPLASNALPEILSLVAVAERGDPDAFFWYQQERRSKSRISSKVSNVTSSGEIVALDPRPTPSKAVVDGFSALLGPWSGL